MAAAAGATLTSIEGPPPPLPLPPPPDPVAFETEAVVFAAVLNGDGVAEADTKLKEDAAKSAAVDANKMLSILLTEFLVFFWLLFVIAELVTVVVEGSMNAGVG